MFRERVLGIAKHFAGISRTSKPIGKKFATAFQKVVNRILTTMKFRACRPEKGKKPELVNNLTDDVNWPATRSLNFAIQGLVAVKNPTLSLVGLSAEEQRQQQDKALFELNVCRGLQSVGVGKDVDCYYEIDREGTYFCPATPLLRADKVTVDL